MTFSLFIYLLLMTPTGIALSWTNAVTATLASLLPDLDTQSSTIGKNLRFISRPLEARFGHRTITHSLVFVAGLFVVLLPLAWWREDAYYCFCVGYATHPLLDSMTVNGVRLFYPIAGHKCVFPMDVNHPHRYRVQTGSRSDLLLGVTFALVSLPAYLVAQEGYERFVRITQGSIESAVRDYNDMSRTHRVFADIRAHNLLTKASLNGRFELLGSVDEQTLVFREQDGRVRTLGMEYRSDFAADRAIAERGEPVVTNVHAIDLSGQRLRELERLLDPDPGALLFGTLAVDRAVAVPEASDGFQPIQVQAGSIRLGYVTVREILDAGLGDLLVVRGTVTVREVVAAGENVVAREVEVGCDAGNGNGSAAAALYRPTRAFTLTAGKGEHIIAVRKEGDTVSIGDTLAARAASPESRERLENLRTDRPRLSGEMIAQRVSYRERRADLLEKCRRDSQDLRLAARLHAAGFAAAVSMDGRKTALARREYQRAELRASHRKSMERMQVRMDRIDQQIRELEAADSLARAALRSPVNGAIRSVRILEQGAGVQAVFSIGVSGP